MTFPLNVFFVFSCLMEVQKISKVNNWGEMLLGAKKLASLIIHQNLQAYKFLKH